MLGSLRQDSKCGVPEATTVKAQGPLQATEGNRLFSLSSGLKLSLKDFAIDAITRGVPNSSIVIDSGPLCKLLGEAENWDNKTKTMQGAKPPRFKRK
jgi:hypothetical protein